MKNKSTENRTNKETEKLPLKCVKSTCLNIEFFSVPRTSKAISAHETIVHALVANILRNCENSSFSCFQLFQDFEKTDFRLRQSLKMSVPWAKNFLGMQMSDFEMLKVCALYLLLYFVYEFFYLQVPHPQIE